METIKIGGKDYPIKLTYNKFNSYIEKYGVLLEKAKQMKEQGKNYNWNMFLFWTVWEGLEKKGFWPFRKPFRSMAHMIDSVLFEEVDALTVWASNKILGSGEDRETKNPQK